MIQPKRKKTKIKGKIAGVWAKYKQKTKYIYSIIIFNYYFKLLLQILIGVFSDFILNFYI